MEIIQHCIKALQGAFLLSKQAIQVEIAVCFVVFEQHNGDVGISTMKVLRQVYYDAGRADCLTSESPSYKTVNRRMGRCADLYETFTHRKVKRAIGSATGKEAIDAVMRLIEPLEIESMDDVAAHAGKPRQLPEPKAAPRDRRATDAPGTIHIKTRHIDLPVPPDTPKSELLALAQKLTKLAERMP